MEKSTTKTTFEIQWVNGLSGVLEKREFPCMGEAKSFRNILKATTKATNITFDMVETTKTRMSYE